MMKTSFFLVIILIISTHNIACIKGDVVTSMSETDALAETETGNAGAVSQSGSTSNQAVVTIGGEKTVKETVSSPVQQTQAVGMGDAPDTIVSASKANSKATTEKGDAVGVSTSDANAARVELNPTDPNANNSVSALSGATASASTEQGNAVAISTTTATASNLLYDASGNLITPPPVTIIIPTTSPFWYDTQKQALDVGVGSQGQLYIVGLDKLLYMYDQITNYYYLVKADFILPGIVRVDTSYDGTPYVVTSAGGVFYLDCGDNWKKLPGCATDIGVGRGGEVYKTGCDAKNNGFAIYRLVCKCKAKSSTKSCRRYNKERESTESRSCDWFRFTGSGVRIDVAPSGWPYVIKVDGSVNGFNGNDWYRVGQIRGLDLSVSNDGILYVVGTDKNLYKHNEENRHTSFTQVCSVSNVMSVTVGPLGLPYVISSCGNVLSSSKTVFN